MKMHSSVPYPESPKNVPHGLSEAKPSYKRQAWLAMFGLLAFMLLYIGLAVCFGAAAYSHLLVAESGKGALFHILIGGLSLVLFIFMIKSLFTVRKAGSPGGVEVTPQQEPVLFEFLHRLADEIGAPKPHRVFITPDVNAAVFYDLSLMNLIFPSKKNLIIGLGLVNVLNLGELKAVLAHEFGHFAQGSMAVGRWVYIAQQIIAHMVATRDWLDSVVRFVSRIDLRIAWVGWLLGLIIWSIRSLMDTLFSLVIIAERALSREMEFNADLVAVSVTGSDALVNALHKLQAADEAWQTALDVAGSEAGNNRRIDDFFSAQKAAIETIGKVINDDSYGVVPENTQQEASLHRVFTEQMAKPPQMWSTHPANRDREDNAKETYIAAEIDERSAWLVFSDAQGLRHAISSSFYKAEAASEMETVAANVAIKNKFNRSSYSPLYCGTYLNRSPVRNFVSVDDLLRSATIEGLTENTLKELYPESVREQLEQARSLDQERHTLEALASGDLKPSGGVIRHRGEELKKSDIPLAIEQIAKERKDVAMALKIHDSNCRMGHLLAAKKVGNGWYEHLLGLISILHCADHLRAVVANEQALLVNTWQVITADGKVGYFEKRRILNTAKSVEKAMHEVTIAAGQIVLPKSILDGLGISNWKEQFPAFDLAPVDKKNWPDWCGAASQKMDQLLNALGAIQSISLEALIRSEAKVATSISGEGNIEIAEEAGTCPKEYPILMPGEEHVLQRKLDLWNRFQLAHGFLPTTLRLLVALSIVGGAIFAGLANLR